MSRPDVPGYSVNQFNTVMSPNYGVPADNRTLATYPTVPTVWSGGRQRPVVSEGEQRSILASTGMLAAGVFAAGAIPLKQGRVWDKYIGAAQLVEQVSPGQILTTFRTSEILSPLETVSRGATMWGGDFWQTPEKQKYLEKLLGKDVFSRHKKDILASGLKLDKTGRLKIGGQAGATVLGRAAKLRSHRKLGQAEFFKNYARAIGADDLGLISREFMPIGGRTMLGAYARFGYASITEMTNRILRVSPTELAELPIMKDMVSNIEAKIGPKFTGSFAHKAFRTVFPTIAPGAAHQTIGRFLTKRVLPGVALFKGYQLADYLTDNSISEVILGGYAQTKIMKARMMEATGLQQLASRQEEIAPGSTSLLGLAAMPMKGAMLGFIGYGARLAYTASKMRKPGIGAAEASLLAVNKFKKAEYNTFFGLGKKMGLGQRTLSSALRRTGALVGLAYIAPFLPGAIAGTDTAEELEAIYSGEKEIAVRKGRWWEAGRTAFEGGRIQYFRQHAIPTFLSRGKVKAIYGSEERKMELDPMLPWNWFDYMQDPYQWEREHYREFPFPMTSPAFADVPLIGPMLAGTIGQMIKPSMLMHTEEWMRQQAISGFDPAALGQGALPTGQMTGELEGYGYGPGQGVIGYRGLMEVKRLPKPFGQQAAYELGEVAQGLPVDPYSPTQLFGEQAYRLTEAWGLPGFTLGAFKGALTGTEEFYDQYERLETARRATGIERAYWDLQIGGGFLSTELFRRLYPHRRRQIDLYNPIRNMMPEWLPGAGEPAPDLLHGFAYGKVAEGEVRLPGRGLAALYPELEGVAPEDYSLIWKYKVLADVAPYAPQTKFYKQMVQGLRTQGSLSERDEEIYQMIQDQLQQKKVFKEFKDRHKFIKQETDIRTVTITKMLSPSTFEIEEMPGVAISMAGLKTSQAALSRLAMTENNQLTQDEAKIRANQKRMRAARELGDIGIRPGEQVEIEISTDVLRQYAKTGSKRPEIRAVVRTAEGININQMMLEGQLAEYDKASAGVLEGQIAYNLLERLAGRYWETGMRVADDPSEFLTPFSPFHKFLGTKTRTAVEEYAAAEAYGTTNAFWDRPWDNFLRPMFSYLGYKLGGTDLPEHILERNEIDEYYDKLKYIKYTRLKNLALTSGNTEAAEEYEKLRRKTAFGADPYGNPLNALLALQKRDKPYFDSFAQASTESERELIMKMFPEYEKHLLRAKWNSEMLGQLYAEKKVKGSLSTEQYEMIEEIQKLRMAEGQAIDPGAMEAYEDYVSDVGQAKVADYADFQRERSLRDYFRGRPLPRQDWVGFHPQVDLEDIKLVVVRNEGRDIHDFNLWESREKMLPYKHYIDEEAIAQVTAEDADMSSGDIQAVLQDILASYGMQNVNITVDKFLRKDPQNLIDLDITRDPLQAGFENAVKQGWI